MDCLVRLCYGGIVRKEDCSFEDMCEELEMFDEPPSFNDLCLRVKEKFTGDFTLKGRFDCGKTRSHFMVMPLRDSANWVRYTKIVQSSNVAVAEVVVEDAYRIVHDVAGPSLHVDPTHANMDIDGQLTQEHYESCPVHHDDDDDDGRPTGQINNDFNVDDFDREEAEQGDEQRIHDDSSDTDSDDSGDEEVAVHAMPVPQPETPSRHGPIPINRTAPGDVPFRDAVHVQGRLFRGDPFPDDPPRPAWVGMTDAVRYVPPNPYTAHELMQLREAGIPFSDVPNYRDVSMTHMAVCDTGLQLCRESVPRHENLIISKGMIFNTMTEVKLFLEDYAVFHHRPFRVTHSDQNMRYQVICSNWCCPWRINARKRGDGKWKITKVVQPHICLDNKGKETHPQLTARYLSRRILGLVDKDNDVSVSYLIESIFTFSNYRPKYGKVWRAKQIALAIRWGSWTEAYNRIPRILCAMEHYNPGLIWFIQKGHDHSTDPATGYTTYMMKRVWWCFAQCQQAFQFCRPVVLVDGTFLTGKYRGVLMMAAAVDPENQIVPLAFALAEGENNESWSWFMGLLRVHVLGPTRTVCMISDRHVGLLNAVKEHIEGYPPLVHRWCMRHFAANFWRRQRNKEVCKKVKDLCCVRTEEEFKETLLDLQKDLNGQAKQWLDGLMDQKGKWALAYDEGGYRYGIMTTNASESFNRVFKGVRALPVSGILEYSFQKCNEYFVKRWSLARNREGTEGPWGKAAREHLADAERWANDQLAEGYGRDRNVYRIRSAGGTTLGGERYGGRNYRVDLLKVECSCNVPQIMHAPCSHMITACRARGYNYQAPPYMSHLYLNEYTMRIWESEFEPYLDPTQWPPYNGDDYVPDPNLMKRGKGRRKKKRLKGDMDAMRGYGDDKYGGGDFNEERRPNLCSECHEPGHKASRHRRQRQQVHVIYL